MFWMAFSSTWNFEAKIEMQVLQGHSAWEHQWGWAVYTFSLHGFRYVLCSRCCIWLSLLYLVSSPLLYLHYGMLYRHCCCIFTTLCCLRCCIFTLGYVLSCHWCVLISPLLRNFGERRVVGERFNFQGLVCKNKNIKIVENGENRTVSAAILNKYETSWTSRTASVAEVYI